MAETGAPEIETLTLGEFARKRDIDAELLKLLASGGHIATIPTRNGSHRFPVDSPLTAELAEEKARAAYDEVLETVGQLVMKAQSRMRRLMDEIEEQQNHLHDIIPLGPGLANVTGSLLGRDEPGSDTIIAIMQLSMWNRVLCNIDEMHRLYAKQQDGAETARGSAVTPKAASRFSPSWWDEQPTPLADELPDGVDDLSPEARRTVLDLLRVLVVAETGGKPR